MSIGRPVSARLREWLAQLRWPSSRPGRVHSPTGTVLVADDESSLRTLTRITLQAQGWTVLEAATPEECLALAIRHQPDVVLLDVNFAGSARDGYSICRELTTRRETKATRVVLFTARDDDESRAFASAVGASAFIVKPFGPLDLVGIVRLVRQEPSGEPAIGLYLIDSGVLRPQQLERAVAEQRLRQGEHVPLGKILVELGYATEDQVASALERQRRRRPIGRAVAPGGGMARVLVADDNASVREALRELLQIQPDLTLVGAASDGAEALRMARADHPDVLVLDSDMPRMSGLEVLEALKASMPELVVLMFTLDDSISDRALALGAAKVVTKDMPLDTLLGEIRRRARPSRMMPSRFVVTSRTASAVAWGTFLRTRRSITLIAVLLVAYAAGFLVGEPAMGASAAVLSAITVAIGGAVLGPELGMVVAILGVVETAALWATTGHAVGEPILRIGGNGAGVVTLIAIGAGFGGMRALRGRFRPRDRQVAALAQAALSVSAGLTPSTLGLLAEAALDLVPGDAVLLFVPVPDGGLELVAAAGRYGVRTGARPERGAIANTYLERRSLILDRVSARSLGLAVPEGGSAVLVPILGRSGPSGVIVALARSPSAYRIGHQHALEMYASFVAALLTTPPAMVAVEPNVPVVAAGRDPQGPSG
jgi:DNA-binding NarL/FixJ family response regulator